MQDETSTPPPGGDELLRMTSQIVSSFVSNNPVTVEGLPDVIRSVYKTVSQLSGTPGPRAEDRPKPAVPISKSVGDDYIVCLEDGKKLKMLKRYLRSRFNMTPDDYRRRWGLPADYPMVAPAYTERRSEFAKKIGLGKGVRKGR
jgi:predicted transcriptional regulator